MQVPIGYATAGSGASAVVSDFMLFKRGSHFTLRSASTSTTSESPSI
jgi:hypothetical protein